MRLLTRGVGVKAIGDVLGHRSLASTCTYLRLDLAMLRGVALRVPGMSARTEVAVRNGTRLDRWDAAAAAYLSSRRALGRAYGRRSGSSAESAHPRAPRRNRSRSRPIRPLAPAVQPRQPQHAAGYEIARL